MEKGVIEVFFEGGLGKVCVFWMAFCGEVVVNCWWNVGNWRACFGGRKYATFWKYFSAGTMANGSL